MLVYKIRNSLQARFKDKVQSTNIVSNVSILRFKCSRPSDKMSLYIQHIHILDVLDYLYINVIALY